MPILKETQVLSINPYDFYRDNEAYGTCFIPREDVFYIGLEVVTTISSLEELNASKLQHPNTFHCGYLSYGALQSNLPFIVENKKSAYAYEPFLWFRYQRWVEVKVSDSSYEYTFFQTQEEKSISKSKSKEYRDEKELPYYSYGDLFNTCRKQDYLSLVKQIKSEISNGDYYQANYTFQTRLPKQAESFRYFDLYCRKYFCKEAVYISLGEKQILSFSPESFFKVSGDSIRVEPIKGTIKSSSNACEKLKASIKDRAELNMISDLFRNDLYRICDLESVEVVEDASCMQLNHLVHLYSSIQGKLKSKDLVTLFHAMFPSGSITGCPKIRSQEAIQALENYDRGIYTGSIGFFLDDKIEMNVAIRTAIATEDSLYYSVGSGIVYDSLPESEWEECLLKAKAFLEVVRECSSL